jgi:hypothetical protein
MAKETQPLTTAETFVLHELKSGRAADLSGMAANDRVLGPEFVERLVTGGYVDPQIERRGVRIIGATLKDRLIVSSTTVPFRVWLERCIFEHGIDFGYTTFARDLSLESSQFGIPSSENQPTSDRDDSEAFFVGMKVDGTAVFSHTTFYVPVDFTYAQIGADFIFDDATYLATEVADFESIKVLGPAFFRRDSFAAALSLYNSELSQLFIEDLVRVLDLDLTQAQIGRNISIKNIRLHSLSAKFLMANGEVRFDRVIPIGQANLAHSHFQNLAITGFEEWLKLKPATLNLEGFSFDGVDINGDTNSPIPAAKMLELINSESCPYSPQAYMELEKFLRARGNSQKADEVYVDMRRRQRQELAWMNRPWDWLLDKTLGYGKQTWRAALTAIFVVVLGMFVFEPTRMEWKDPRQPQGKYSRFWYSLDQLAPVIDLEAAKSWGPKQTSGWTQNYALLHRTLGWILLPLIIGAITGIIK